MPYDNNGIRTCPTCNLIVAFNKHDPCIENLPNTDDACCGHGYKEEAYVSVDIGEYPDILRGQDALDYFYFCKQQIWFGNKGQLGDVPESEAWD